MAYSEHSQQVILCYCSNGNNRCPTYSNWVFGLTANANVNSSARTWNVTAKVTFNFPNNFQIISYTVTGHDMTVNGQNYGNKGGYWTSSAGPTSYLEVVVASGTYDTNGNPSQSSVNVSASTWIGLFTNACDNSGSRRYNASTSVTVSIPTIAALNRPPSISSGRLTSSNPNVYQLNAGISGIDWGLGYSYTSLTCRISYSLDGVSYSYTAGSWSSSSSSRSFSIDGMTLAPSAPWTKVPDDGTVTITWTASTNIGSSTASTTRYCMGQYDAYVITENGVIPADLFASTVGAAPNPSLPIRRVLELKG